MSGDGQHRASVRLALTRVVVTPLYPPQDPEREVVLFTLADGKRLMLSKEDGAELTALLGKARPKVAIKMMKCADDPTKMQVTLG